MDFSFTGKNRYQQVVSQNRTATDAFFFPLLLKKPFRFLRITMHQALPLISAPALGRSLPVLPVTGHKPALCPRVLGSLGLTLPCLSAPKHPATGSVLPQKAQPGAAHLLEEPSDAEHPLFPIRRFVPISLAHALLALTQALPCLLLPALPCPPGAERHHQGKKGDAIRRCNSPLVWAGRKLPLSQKGK